MTNRELIKILSELPQDLEVYGEGCDCEGKVIGACVWLNDDDQQAILIKRNEY